MRHPLLGRRAPRPLLGRLPPQRARLVLQALRLGPHLEPPRLRPYHLPVAPPQRVRRGQLGPRQPRRRAHQHLARAHPPRVHLVPRAPPARQAGVHEPLEAELLQVRDALLLLALERLLHPPLELRLLPAPLGHRPTRLAELLRELLELASQLQLERVGQLLGTRRSRLARRLGRARLLELPVVPPVAVARRQLGLGQRAAGLAQQAQLVRALAVELVPRAPSAREALLEQPAHAHVLQVRDALLLLLLERLLHLTLELAFVAAPLAHGLLELRELLAKLPAGRLRLGLAPVRGGEPLLGAHRRLVVRLGQPRHPPAHVGAHEGGPSEATRCLPEQLAAARELGPQAVPPIPAPREVALGDAPDRELLEMLDALLLLPLQLRLRETLTLRLHAAPLGHRPTRLAELPLKVAVGLLELLSLEHLHR